MGDLQTVSANLTDWVSQTLGISWGAIVLIGFLVWLFFIHPARAFPAELDRNEKVPPPEARQLRWHIRHMREELAFIARLLTAILALLFFWMAHDFGWA